MFLIMRKNTRKTSLVHSSELLLQCAEENLLLFLLPSLTLPPKPPSLPLEVRD